MGLFKFLDFSFVVIYTITILKLNTKRIKQIAAAWVVSLLLIEMKLLRSELFLPMSLEQAWDFFSSPKNLNEITPPDMVFKITSDVPEKMYEGMFITYKIAPMFNIPLDWVTEITQIKELEYFVDEQRKGPYNIWHHEHHFKAVKGGVLMTDILYYDIGKSIFGWLAGKLFVDEKVAGIFEYRSIKLGELFTANNLG